MKKYKPVTVSGTYDISELTLEGPLGSTDNNTWSGIKKIYTVPTGSTARLMAGMISSIIPVLKSSGSEINAGNAYCKINNMAKNKAATFVIGYSGYATSRERMPYENPVPNYSEFAPLKTFKDTPIYLNEGDYLSIYFRIYIPARASINDYLIDKGSYTLSFIEESEV